MADLRTRGHFAHYFLPQVGAPKTENTMLAMMCWAQAEGQGGRFNMLNSTLITPGSWPLAGNTHGVRNYSSFKEGVWANARTLNYGAKRGLYGYKPIRYALHIDAPPRRALEAIEASAWGTGGLALRVYETTPDSVILDYRLKPLVQ